MSTTTDDLKNKLATRQEGAVQQSAEDKDPLVRLFKPYRNAIAAALPKHLTPERMIRIAQTCIRTTPNLANADPLSLIAAVIKSSQLGLEPGVLNQAWILPFKDNKTGKTFAEFLIGYHGYVELMYRSDRIASISAHEVYEWDLFDYEYGLNERLVHKPNLEKEPDPAKITHVYAVAHFKGGGATFVILTRKQVEAIRKRGRGSTSSYSPWSSDYAAMCRKTAIRQLSKYVPLSAEVMQGLSQDETVSTLSVNAADSAEIVDVSVAYEQPVLTE